MHVPQAKSRRSIVSHACSVLVVSGVACCDRAILRWSKEAAQSTPANSTPCSRQCESPNGHQGLHPRTGPGGRLEWLARANPRRVTFARVALWRWGWPERTRPFGTVGAVAKNTESSTNLGNFRTPRNRDDFEYRRSNHERVRVSLTGPKGIRNRLGTSDRQPVQLDQAA
jgi:hypothetical protein